MKNLLNQIRNTVLSQGLFKSGDKVIVAASGGPDSVFLLYALNQLKHELGIDLLAAHVNHGLRKGSAVDQRFVENLARTWRLPFITTTLVIKKKKNKSSIEELARDARFGFLIKTAQRFGCDSIALGHTQDDLAETVLMRILRGTGLLGMRGILPKRKIYGVYFVRPLLNIEHRAIEIFLKRKNIKFRIDPSNKKPIFFRNKIRLQLMPFLSRHFNPDVRHTLANLANTMATDYDFLKQSGEELAKKLFLFPKNRRAISLKLDALTKLHPSMQRNLIRLAVEKLKGDTRRLTFAHIKEIESLIANRPPKSSVNLPQGVIITKESSLLCLRLRNS